MTDLEEVIDTIKRNVPSQSVTMGKPLEPWGPTRFHKTLALHIHRATRPASHSFRAANYGIMEDEESAKKWDFEA